MLTKALPTTLVNIKGYIFERKDRKSNKGGGTGIYIKDGINYVRRYDLETENVECIWIEVKMKSSKTFIIGVLYRSPDSLKHLSKTFAEDFIKSLKYVNSENKECIIISDINCNYLDKKSHRSLKDLIQLQGLQQIIKEATRVNTQSQTLIDVILTNASNNLCHAAVIPSSPSDHDVIGCIRKIHNIKIQGTTIKCRDYSDYCQPNVDAELSSANWDAIYEIKNVNTTWNIMKSSLVDIINRHAPVIEKQVKGITRELK